MVGDEGLPSTFTADPSSPGVSLVRRIANHFRSGIVEGQYRVGARLPTVRHVAAQVGTTAETVAAAYRILSEQGLVRARTGIGTVVLPQGGGDSAAGLATPGVGRVPIVPPLATPSFHETYRRLLHLDRETASGGFASYTPALDLYPREAGRLLRAALRRDGARLFEMGAAEGDPALRGALAERLTGVGPFESARVRVDAAGRITAFSGATTQGQGLETTLAQVAADELGVTPEDVTVIAGDTAGVEHGTGSFASRAAVVGGSAVALAARDVSAKARLLAAKALGCAEAELEQAGTAFADRRRPERRVTFAELARLAGAATAALGVEPGLESTRFFQPTDMTYSSGAHVALVELDPLSACVRILGYWISHDSGRLINPLVVEGQLQGAVALGIGSALLEEITYDESGQLLAGSYMDYLLPTATDVPTMAIDHLETLSPLNPLGLKGVGESGALPVPAVLASAIENAVGPQGGRVTRMPLGPARLLDLLPPAPRLPAPRA